MPSPADHKLHHDMRPLNDADFVKSLRDIVGARNVVTDQHQSLRHRKGFRSGEGAALAVVFPRRLLEQWRVLQTCVAAGKAVIMQAANTSLTGGSTPEGDRDEYGRDVVIINTLLIREIRVINQGRQVICHSGATLHHLERLLQPYGRETHSEIGSSCLGASVVGGICNNSGGMLVRRGPAYTEMAMYARLDASGAMCLVNHLGVQLGDTAEEMLERLDEGAYTEDDLMPCAAGKASSTEYQSRVRDVNASTPARYNADPTHLYEASGSAGKLAVFAVRLDTFEADSRTQIFYVGAHDPSVFTELRRRLLAGDGPLPVMGEYMHRDAFDMSARYAKDMFATIERFGTNVMPSVFAWKARVDRLFGRWNWLPKHPADRIGQKLSQLLPNHLPHRLREFRGRFEHHLLLKMEGGGIEKAQVCLDELMAESGRGEWFACTDEEGKKALLHRVVTGGAAIRFSALHSDEVEGAFALDFALPRNETDWFERLPRDIEEQLVAKLSYGHFMCHVFHHDYIVKKGADLKAVKQRVLDLIKAKGGEYPAEHNVGHSYAAMPALAAFYRELDPTNSFNPGVGQMSKRKLYAKSA
jgi:D-lactate dehydrogenase